MRMIGVGGAWVGLIDVGGACRGRNNGRSSVNFRAFFQMTAQFSMFSVSVTDHVRIIAQLA